MRSNEIGVEGASSSRAKVPGHGVLAGRAGLAPDSSSAFRKSGRGGTPILQEIAASKGSEARPSQGHGSMRLVSTNNGMARALAKWKGFHAWAHLAGTLGCYEGGWLARFVYAAPNTGTQPQGEIVAPCRLARLAGKVL